MRFDHRFADDRRLQRDALAKGLLAFRREQFRFDHPLDALHPPARRKPVERGRGRLKWNPEDKPGAGPGCPMKLAHHRRRICDAGKRAVHEEAVDAVVLEGKPFARAELVCIAGRPSDEALYDAEELERRSPTKQIQLRYVNGIDDLRRSETPTAHLALISGLGERTGGRNVSFSEAQIADPTGHADPLFAGYSRCSHRF